MGLHRDAKIDLIKRVPLFAHCSSRELTKIAQITDELHVDAGRRLTWEGDFGHEFLVIIDGDVDVQREGESVTTLHAGDFFGEVSLVTNEPRNATVVAATPAQLLVIAEREFRTLLRAAPEVNAAVRKAVDERAS